MKQRCSPRRRSRPDPRKLDRPSGASLAGRPDLSLFYWAKWRDIAERKLAEAEKEKLQARNGTEAIGEVQGYGDRIDLLLTDVVMPGMNGNELAKQLVRHNPEMKVLFTSGYTEDVISHRGVLAEGVSFIGKPYTPLALARKVREVLDKA